MRKLFTNKNKKGFAMAELLAVSIVLLFIFSILFSNYLPLLAEYETRLSYNDVTAQYAAHYIRKMYKEALEDETQSETLKTTINSGINSKGFYYVLKEDSNSVCNQVLEKDKSNCEKIIDQYDIEEIIITNYKLKDDTDTTTKYVKKNYEQKDGSLYNYIGYLPNYEKSIYTGKEEGEQLYRIILKTKDFGYATTPILSDYKTPSSCFEGEINDTGITITKYNYNEENGCGKTVIIKNTPVTISGISGRKITAIGEGVFEKRGDGNPAYQVEEVFLSDSVQTIGKNSFKGSNLKELPDLRKVNSIGDYAFANTKIQEADLTNYPSSSTIGDYAFSSNGNLETVKFSQNIDSSAGIIVGNYAFANNKILGTVTLPKTKFIYSANKDDSGNPILAEGLFAESGTSTEDGIPVEIPDAMKKIGAKMFYLAKIKSIDLGKGVQDIDYMAFSQYENNDKKGFDLYDKKLIIPSTVENVAYGYYKDNAGKDIPKSDCFRGLGITELIIEGDSQEPALSIGVAAFKQNSITELNIKPRVKQIGVSAFENSKIQTLRFSDVIQLETIQKKAFFDNNIKNLKFPDSLKEIESYAFANNNNLDTLSLNKVSSIRERAFASTGIKDLVIPSSVTLIDISAFNGCRQLEKLEIDEGVDSLNIRDSAFIDNSNLKNIIISARVNSIKNNAFSGILQDAEITNYSKITESKDWCNIFDANNSTCSGSVENENKMKITYMDVSNNEIRRYIYLGGATNE